jgi:hypothetical protein
MLISTSIGALMTAKTFLMRKRVRESVMSDSRPTMNVALASERPMMVRYCMCHPKEAFLQRCG